MRVALLVTLTLVLAAVTASPLHGQAVAGSLQVTVADASTGAPLAGADVGVRHARLLNPFVALSDAEGSVRFPSLPVGPYLVTIRLIGYRDVVVERVDIGLGQASSLTVEMASTPVPLDPLVITASRDLDFTSTEVVSSLRSETFRALPIDRDFQSVVPLLAHANATYLPDGVAVGGSTGLENAWHIDGVNVTDPVRPQTSIRLPYNFVEEVRLRTGGYQAEFGRALGGVVDVVTASGGDDFGGDIFAFATPSGLAGAPRSVFVGAPAGEVTSYDVGGSIRGPIVRGVLRFFVAYNARVDRSTEQVPGLLPEHATRTTHMFAGKLSWQVSQRTRFELSVFGDPSTADEVGNPGALGFVSLPTALLNRDPFLRKVRDGGYAATMRAQARLSPWLLLEGSAARYDRLLTDRPRTQLGASDPLFVDVVTGEWSGGVGLAIDEERTRRESLRGSTTVLVGPHTLTGAVEYDRNYYSTNQGTAYVARGDDVGFILRFDDTTFGGLAEYRDKEVSDRIVASYLQDSWQVTDWLVVNAGARWATQSYIGVGDTIAQSFGNQWQPRLGVVVAPWPGRTHKLFASVGRHYLQLPLLLTMDRHGKGTVVSCAHAWSQDPRDPPIVNSPAECFSTEVEPRAEGIQGEHSDEVVVGYEGGLLSGFHLAVRGIYRTLREAWGAGFDPTSGEIRLGNPGRGALGFLPRPTRRHASVEVSLRRSDGPVELWTSYVLSRTHGNYSGIYSSADGDFPAQVNVALELAEQAINSTGLLPNDRTHVFKAGGSYAFDFDVDAGLFFTAQSGIPLSRLGQSSFGFGRPLFLVERGSAGRTPAIWDLDVRLSYRWPSGMLPGGGRIILDLRNIGSPQRAVLVEQYQFVDAQNSIPNPTFGRARMYQPPMSVRLGMEIGL